MRRLKKKKNPYQINLRPLRILPIQWLFKRVWADNMQPRYYKFSFRNSIRLSPILNETYGEIHLCTNRSSILEKLQNYTN